MTQKSDPNDKINLPQKGAAQRIRERYAQHRQSNFIDAIIYQPIIQWHRSSAIFDDEPDSLGVQWFSGIRSPSRLRGYPDQSYWQNHSLVFMIGRHRWCLTIRGRRMPFRNYDQFMEWRKDRRKLLAT